MRKRLAAMVLAIIMTVGMLPLGSQKVEAKTTKEIETQIANTYATALKNSKKVSFTGACGTYVYQQLMVLGITSKSNGNGNTWYGKFSEGEVTTGGYIARKKAGANCLTDLTKAYGNELYNIVVSWKNTKSNGDKYGHVCFIHAIKEGKVYWSESQNTWWGPKEGAVCVATISKFMSYYSTNNPCLGAIYFEKKNAALSAPTNFKVNGMLTATTNTYPITMSYRDTVNLTWTAVSGATKYKVEPLIWNGSQWVEASGYAKETTGTSITYNNLTVRDWAFKVTAGNAAGFSTNVATWYKLSAGADRTATFLDWDGTVLKTQDVPVGRSATAPANPSREGYTFKAWDKTFTNLMTDITVTAVYDVKTYSVKFLDINGSVVKTQTVSHGQSATPPVPDHHIGRVFICWDTIYTNVTHDLMVKPVYERVGLQPPDVANLVSVARNISGMGYDVDVQLLFNVSGEEFGNVIIALKTSEDKVVAYVAEVCDLAALKASPKSFYVPYSGIVTKAEVFIVKPHGNEGVGSPIIWASDWKYTAAVGEEDNGGTEWHFEGSIEAINRDRNTMLIVYSENDGDITEQLQYVEQLMISGAFQEDMINYSFTFKTKDEPSVETGDFIVMLTFDYGTDPIYIGRIKAPTGMCNVVFVDDNNIIDTQEVVVGSSAELPEPPKKEGYNFVGWDKSATNVREDLEIVALYEKKKVSIIFKDEDNGEIMVKAFDYGESITLDEVPEKEGHTFVGWSVAIAEENMTVTPMFNINEYKITFLDWDGEILEEQIVEYGGEAELPTIDSPGEGFVFKEWSDPMALYYVTANVMLSPIAELEETAQTPTINATKNATGYIVTFSAEAGAKIYYTLNGELPEYKEDDEEPVVVGALYSGSVSITEDAVLLAIAVVGGKNNSEVAFAEYIFETSTGSGNNTGGSGVGGGAPKQEQKVEPGDEPTLEQELPPVDTWKFNDVKINDWFHNDVKYAVENGLFKGITETTFEPNSPMTRAMIITVLARYAGVDTESGEMWYSKAVELGVAKGITDGTNPNDNVTREQLAALLWRFAEQPEGTGNLSSFVDNGKISEWAVDALEWTNGKGLINGYPDGTVNPQGNATRAEVAAIMHRFVEAMQ